MAAAPAPPRAGTAALVARRPGLRRAVAQRRRLGGRRVAPPHPAPPPANESAQPATPPTSPALASAGNAAAAASPPPPARTRGSAADARRGRGRRPPATRTVHRGGRRRSARAGRDISAGTSAVAGANARSAASNLNGAADSHGDGEAGAPRPRTGGGGGGTRRSGAASGGSAPPSSTSASKDWRQGLARSDDTVVSYGRLNPFVYLKARLPSKTAPEIRALSLPIGRCLHARLYDRAVYEQELASGDPTRVQQAAATAEILNRAIPEPSADAPPLVDCLALPEISYHNFKQAVTSPETLKRYYESAPESERRLMRMAFSIWDVRTESEQAAPPRNGLIGGFAFRMVAGEPETGTRGRDDTVMDIPAPHLRILALTKVHMLALFKAEEEGPEWDRHMPDCVRQVCRNSAFVAGQAALAEVFEEKQIEGLRIVPMTLRRLSARPGAPEPAPPLLTHRGDPPADAANRPRARERAGSAGAGASGGAAGRHADGAVAGAHERRPAAAAPAPAETAPAPAELRAAARVPGAHRCPPLSTARPHRRRAGRRSAGGGRASRAHTRGRASTGGARTGALREPEAQTRGHNVAAGRRSGGPTRAPSGRCGGRACAPTARVRRQLVHERARHVRISRRVGHGGRGRVAVGTTKKIPHGYRYERDRTRTLASCRTANGSV